MAKSSNRTLSKSYSTTSDQNSTKSVGSVLSRKTTQTIKKGVRSVVRPFKKLKQSLSRSKSKSSIASEDDGGPPAIDIDGNDLPVIEILSDGPPLPVIDIESDDNSSSSVEVEFDAEKDLGMCLVVNMYVVITNLPHSRSEEDLAVPYLFLLPR